MGNTPSHRSLPVAICSALVIVIATYFGFSLGDDSSETSSGTSSAALLRSSPTPASDEENCPLESLPTETKDVVGDILAGGPFEYPDNDGVRFGNYEGVLPKESRNYYREYTVDTPGLNHRGERRIVTGGGTETDPEVWYYTDDHYETFCLIPDAED